MKNVLHIFMNEENDETCWMLKILKGVGYAKEGVKQV